MHTPLKEIEKTPSDLVDSISKKCQDSLAALRTSYAGSDFSTIIEGSVGILPSPDNKNDESHDDVLLQSPPEKPQNNLDKLMRPTAASSGRKTRKLTDLQKSMQGKYEKKKRENSMTPLASKDVDVSNIVTPKNITPASKNVNNKTPKCSTSKNDKLSFTDCLKKKWRKSFDFRQAKVSKYNLVHGFDGLSDSTVSDDDDDVIVKTVPKGASKFMAKLARDQVRLQVSLNAEKGRAAEYEREARLAKSGLKSIVNEMNMLRQKIEQQQEQNKNLVLERDSLKNNFERQSVTREHNENELVSLLQTAQQERDNVCAELQHIEETHSTKLSMLDRSWENKVNTMRESYELQLQDVKVELEAVREEHKTLQIEYDNKCNDFTKLMAESQVELEFFQSELYEARMMKNLTESEVQTDLRIHDIPRDGPIQQQHLEPESDTEAGIQDALVELFRQAHRPPRRSSSRPFSTFFTFSFDQTVTSNYFYSF